MSEQFTAQDARDIMSSSRIRGLEYVLDDIKKEAEKGEHVLQIYKPMTSEIQDALKELGFKVSSYDSMAIQRDNLYYSIHWKE